MSIATLVSEERMAAPPGDLPTPVTFTCSTATSEELRSQIQPPARRAVPRKSARSALTDGSLSLLARRRLGEEGLVAGTAGILVAFDGRASLPATSARDESFA
jgi:hypothetical protein